MAATFIALGAVTGCHKKASGVNPNTLGPTPAAASAPTATITADPLAIDLGQSVVLNWRTQNATSSPSTASARSTSTAPRPSRPPTPPTSISPQRATAAPPRPTFASPSACPSLPPHLLRLNARHGQRSGLPPERSGRLLRLRQLRAPSRRPDGCRRRLPPISHAHPAIKIVIGGYCDDRGSAEYNLALGENRANAARTALVSAGVAPQPSARHQLRQREAVLHRRDRELLAAEPPGPVLARSLTLAIPASAQPLRNSSREG